MRDPEAPNLTQLRTHFKDLGVVYAEIDLKVRPIFGELLKQDESCEFDFTEATQVLIQGKSALSAEVVNKMAVDGTLTEMIPAGCIRESLDAKLKKLINQKPVMLFMKGVPEAPECGFSKKIVALLSKYVGTIIPEYGHFNIYSDEQVREGLKKYSNWPTFPQLYVHGKLLGGLDICLDLDEEGELEDALTADAS